jgi:endonuclease G, mitochondrial
MSQMQLYFIFCLVFFITPPGIGQKADILLPSERVREQIIHHTAFSLSYNSSYLLPSWVSYKVTKSQVNLEDKVNKNYTPDPEVNTRSANKKDYKDGGYLMAQFVNYLDIKQIPGAVEEAFYMTNIAPMKLAFYNHIWIKTEEIIRTWTAGNDGFYVVCGPILADSPFPAIGENNVSIPKRFYKAIYDPKNQKALGFIFQNSMTSGSLKSFVVSVDQIELETGLDLFPSLDDALEKQVESNTNLGDWNFEIVE